MNIRITDIWVECDGEVFSIPYTDFEDNSLSDTVNSSMFKKLLRRHRVSQRELICHICPYHRKDNGERTPKRSWKWKRKTQYKPS